MDTPNMSKENQKEASSLEKRIAKISKARTREFAAAEKAVARLETEATRAVNAIKRTLLTETKKIWKSRDKGAGSRKGEIKAMEKRLAIITQRLG